MKLLSTVGALGLVGFTALSAPAMAAEGLGWYGGLGLGQSRARIHDDRIAAQLARSGLVMDSIEEDARDFGFKVFGGWQFHPNLAFEAGYFNLGEFGFSANTTPAGTYTGNARFQGLNADAVGFLPLTGQFSLLGRVGITYVETRGEFSGTGAVAVTDTRPRKNETSVKFGLGAQYAFTDSLALRAEWERYVVKDAVGNKGDIDMMLVGLVYSFGGGR